MRINHDTGKLAGLAPSASPRRMQRQHGEGAPVPTHPATLLTLTLQATRCGQNFPKPRGGWIRLSRVTTSKCLILPLRRQQTASAVWWQTRGAVVRGGAGWVHPCGLPCASEVGKSLHFPMLLLGKAAAPHGTGQQIKVRSGMGRVGSITRTG